MDQIAAHLPGMLLAWAAFFITAASPGPANLATIGTSMTAGRKAGLAQACGTVSVSFFWGTMAAIGLGALLVQYATALIALKIVGGLYLLWLAFKSFRAASKSSHLNTPGNTTHGSLTKFYIKGVLIHITNPKPIFGWIATIALGVTQSTPVSIYILIVVVGTLTSLAINVSYAVSFSSDTVSRVYSKFHHWFEITFGIMFAAAGLKLLSSVKQP